MRRSGCERLAYRILGVADHFFPMRTAFLPRIAYVGIADPRIWIRCEDEIQGIPETALESCRRRSVVPRASLWNKGQILDNTPSAIVQYERRD